MRRFLLYILVLLLPVMVLAQQSRSLEIDVASFKPVNTDPLTGVAIDKIDVDNSLRPCARIKLKINRMTRADIENVQINVMGGIHDVMKKVVAHEGNGLIIELTAKPQTRFYLHHDKYGDSNEVTLNLEGNKEYRLDAELCVLQTIAINTNVAGAEVYIDGVFKGKTDERCICTIGDMTHGVHKVRVAYGAASNEQDIEINGSSVYFRIEVAIASATPQYVVLSVVPQEAVVLIDGKEYTPDKGVVYTLLNRGTYNYSVSAKDYHTDSGSFTVSDAKVVKDVKLRPAHGWLKVSGDDELQGARVFVDGTFVGTAPLTTDRLASGEHSVRIVKTLYKPFEGKVVITDGKTLDYAPSLVADFATVSLNVGGECDIYVNNEKKGRGSWRGDLATGTYIFEARKAGHTTTSITKTISAEPRQQSYTLPAPQPILGKLNVTSSPAMADVYVDGKVVGQTPLMVDLVVGKHEVSLRKGELGSEKQSVNITEGQMANLNLTLVEAKRQSTISYTTKDNSKVKLKREAFDAKVISHTCENGVGTILFEKQITKIGNSAFANCDGLTSITIPNSVTSIGTYAFYSCDGLIIITIPNSVTSIGDEAFSGCRGLTSITIPNSVTKIGDKAFWNCDGLISITIPNSVTSIGKYAFAFCDGLIFITIPNSVSLIGDYAFNSCEGLRRVYCKDTIPPMLGGSYVFDKNASSRIIYVPRASVRIYKSASGWSKYASSIVGYDF